MKKFLVLAAVLCAITSVYASPGISFSEDTSGRWDYTATDQGVGVFSFTQPITVTSVVGSPTDTLLTPPATVDIPDLTVSSLTEVYSGIYTGNVAAGSSIQIMDGTNLVMAGNLTPGSVLTVGTSGNFYAVSIDDIEVTSVNTAYNSSAFIGAIGVGSVLDFVMTLNCTSSETLADMILNGHSTDGAANSNNRSLSGSIAVPEPATLALLGLGGLFLQRKKVKR